MPHTVSHWLMPPPPWKPKGKPYRSSFKMTEAAARALGALEPVPRTSEEREEAQVQSAGQDGVRGDPHGSSRQ